MCKTQGRKICCGSGIPPNYEDDSHNHSHLSLAKDPYSVCSRWRRVYIGIGAEWRPQIFP